MRTDGRTDKRRDMIKLTVAIRSFGKETKERSLVKLNLSA
jgi:hypothetical protein